MTPNLFSAIAETDEDFKITSRESFLRKASKKLKEIEILKEKGKYNSLTADECLKLEKESFWEACLYEETKPSKPNPKEERKRKKEEEQRQKQEEQKKKEEEQRRLYEEYKRKIEEEQRQKREQEKKQEQKRKEEERKRKKQEKKDKKIKQNCNSLSLEEEYRNLLLLHRGNNNKTFRLLSLKYHPDKNVGKQTWANEMQKKLVDCREMFSN